MAKLVVPTGPLGLRGIPPPPQQRRAIALELRVLAGIGNEDYCYTPPLGNRLWLYSIDVWAYCGTPGNMLGGVFYIMFGTAIPKSAGEIAVTWNPIVPLHCGVKIGFGWFECEDFHRHFSMAKLFTADELRFGVTIQNGFNQDWQATVAFEISEG